MTDAPPSRYRVVEKDGLLVVIDNGEPLESLVMHSHPVVTPRKQRAAAKKTRTLEASTEARQLSPGDRPSLSLPVGPGGNRREVPIDQAVTNRIGVSIIAAIAVFIFAGPVLVFPVIAIAVALSFRRSDGESITKKLFRGWARWIARA